MKDLPKLSPQEMDFLQNARIDSDRLIMGILCIILIFTLWVIVLGGGIENRLVDGLLGATVTAFVLIVQFFFRASGHKK